MNFISSPITLETVSLLQVVFAFMSAFGAALVFQVAKFRLLALFLAFQSVLCVLNIAENNALLAEVLITPAFTLLFGPLLYLLVSSLTGDEPKVNVKTAAHFIPALLALSFTSQVQTVVLLGTLSQLVYIFVCFIKLGQYHSLLKSVSSQVDTYSLKWLSTALGVFSALLVLDLVRMNTQTITPLLLKKGLYFASELIFFSLSCYLIFKVLRSPEVFDDIKRYQKLLNESQNAQQDDALAQAIFTDIEHAVWHDKLYSQPRLTISELAEHTGFKVRDISWAVNKMANRNFSDYINSLRARAVKDAIEKAPHSTMPLINIALDHGFNSKSTFFNSFKKEFELTPMQFKKQLMSRRSGS
ncbi:helix-turn-helix transcriptional regulator [Pseudoalteromonas sp. JBTF-M23]|uniref:Helix-turn-helix transcriptional regulator n=1 Tax=Pseudoalteromonas caenipelagi TaxID=2726988 RepID=A0A849VFB6_9GAMM|nr:AraC family transcriptional regulator [Pseudoalteromonas caenipelagi]NOU51956.1 helix-turn-helix transcriptional regulator [Pseudoalteromonas caenipelagi]